jgi:hypothetical protein
LFLRKPKQTVEGHARTETLAMTTRDFLFLMVVFPLAIILGIVAFVGLQEMAMLEMNDLGGAFPLYSHKLNGVDE